MASQAMQYRPIYTQVKFLPTTLHVPMDSVQIAHFPPANGRWLHLATKDLNGCHCIIIASPNAAIMAHIGPSPGLGSSSSQSDQHVAFYVNQAIALFRAYRPLFNPSQTWIIAGADERGMVVLHDHVQSMQQMLQSEGLITTHRVYEVILDRDRYPGGVHPNQEKGCVVVEYRPRYVAGVWIEGYLHN